MPPENFGTPGTAPADGYTGTVTPGTSGATGSGAGVGVGVGVGAGSGCGCGDGSRARGGFDVDAVAEPAGLRTTGREVAGGAVSTGAGRAVADAVAEDVAGDVAEAVAEDVAGDTADAVTEGVADGVAEDVALLPLAGCSAMTLASVLDDAAPDDSATDGSPCFSSGLRAGEEECSSRTTSSSFRVSSMLGAIPSGIPTLATFGSRIGVRALLVSWPAGS